jgi:hypothetical protein
LTGAATLQTTASYAADDYGGESNIGGEGGGEGVLGVVIFTVPTGCVYGPPSGSVAIGDVERGDLCYRFRYRFVRVGVAPRCH